MKISQLGKCSEQSFIAIISGYGIAVYCVIFLSIFLLSQSIFAQPLRQFNVCDSTEYTLNTDTTIIVSRYKIYLETNSDINLLYDFTAVSPENYFIKDFDIIRPNLWYLLIGNRYIGFQTKLYKSDDRGNSWSIDTNYFSAIDSSILDGNNSIDPFNPNYYNSINQIQKIGEDTIFLFIGYYSSGIIYSTNGGSEWKHWFANIPAHYYGMFECNDLYYLYQLEGDGFMGRMFPFEKQYLFRNDSEVNFNHGSSGSGHHPRFNIAKQPNVLYYSNLSNCEVYPYLLHHVDSICAAATSIGTAINDYSNLTLYPNPNRGNFNIELNQALSPPIMIVIYNSIGQVQYSQFFENSYDLSFFTINSDLNSGLHYLWVKSQGHVFVKKFIVN